MVKLRILHVDLSHQMLEKHEDFKKLGALQQVEKFLRLSNTEAYKSFFGYVPSCSCRIRYHIVYDLMLCFVCSERGVFLSWRSFFNIQYCL